MGLWVSTSIISRCLPPPHAAHRFSGTAGQAIVSKTAAYLVTDSRYWLQAREALDPNWHLIPAGGANAPKDWVDWVVVGGS